MTRTAPALEPAGLSLATLRGAIPIRQLQQYIGVALLIERTETRKVLASQILDARDRELGGDALFTQFKQ